MVKRLSVANLLRLQDYFSYIEVSHLLILVYQEKHHLKLLSLYNKSEEHISRAIVFKVLVGIFALAALFLFSSIIVWYVSHGNTF